MDMGGQATSITREFEIRLAKPSKYFISWDMNASPVGLQQYVIWNEGNGPRGYPHQLDVMFKNFEGNNLVFSAGLGISGGASFSVPMLFFDFEGNILKLIKNLRIIGEESVQGDDCYILSGDSNVSLDHRVWISKESFFIRKIAYTSAMNLLQEELYEIVQPNKAFLNKDFKY